MRDERISKILIYSQFPVGNRDKPKKIINLTALCIPNDKI